ncbi:NfeD family protein [Lusitaniella coriacea LEGE 07157]|uniref:NfeD family protein n=1 Tax=Lusitaniella coriacea LEGE 07157 TaxID=945747 RepID=A0A8J7DT17_9CYAN|nr:NfeD family protein [Lusitaniella coriacea]MBE9115147.1 NfeD family protein [Lusitaniella coriacea LEGE 07157]
MGVFYRPSQINKFPEPLNGTVEEAIAQDRPGRVKCVGTSWPARIYEPEGSDRQSMVPGTKVDIIARQGIAMLVMPARDFSYISS